ncbi:MAG: hypothetical protein ACHREM_27045, partial [Polyangiales bacterium]
MGATACGGTVITVIDDAGPPPPSGTSIASATCAPDPTLPAGAEIVACGFAPNLELVGVDDASLYALTNGGQFFRIDKASGASTQLYSWANRFNNGEPRIDGIGSDVQLAGGRIYFVGDDGLVSIDAASPSEPTVVLGPVFETMPIFDDAAFYWLRVTSQPGSVQFVDVQRTPIAGGVATTVDPTYAFPVTVAN